jgi:hypothetical protein
VSDEQPEPDGADLLPQPAFRSKILDWATHPIAKFLAKLGLGARGEAVAELFEGPRVREAEKQGEFLNDTLILASLTPDELAAKIESNPGLEELVLEALDIAGRTRQTEMITTLRRGAAKGLTDDAFVDESHFLIRTMGRIEGPPLHRTHRDQHGQAGPSAREARDAR